MGAVEGANLDFHARADLSTEFRHIETASFRSALAVDETVVEAPISFFELWGHRMGEREVR